MKKNWRLIIDDKKSGDYNMATDEALLWGYEQYQMPTLRVYGWQQPWITIGYNQNPTQVLKYKRGPLGSPVIPYVRRITGGAAILHHQELTYSLVCSPYDLSLPGKVKDSYKKLCAFLFAFYRQLGISVQFAGESKSVPVTAYKHFCFATNEQYDIVVRGKKIGGNAQRRRRGLIFQHGSIPQSLDFDLIQENINQTDILPEKTIALNDILMSQSDFLKLRRTLAESFQQTFEINFEEQDLFPEEAKLRDQLIKEKYTTTQWNDNRRIKSVGAGK